MSFNKKWIAAAAAGSMLLSTAVWAEGNMKTIQVLMENIGVSVNGQQAALTKDSILHNGSVYVPLRSLAEMLGAEVSWNAALRSVNIDFIMDDVNELQTASQTGIYQYIALQNNDAMKRLKNALEQTSSIEMSVVRDRYGALAEMSSDLGNEELALSFSKLEASVELLRGGWESKNLDDYGLAWSIYNTNAQRVNQILKSKLSQ